MLEAAFFQNADSAAEASPVTLPKTIGTIFSSCYDLLVCTAAMENGAAEVALGH